ncbi:hypothetical protein HG535_0C01110 [Zygotorulaspora mrakii]|uniref:GAF domain-containing protein n=1 Tax=Zygotorulaspora mrakii TaxID=42260 RepID=A0A7H9B1X7_ZYGMR|nr:uncharacterized protein HG535_0C01110 [Zygotorulaspora mrakii]QLG71762.1 hypothetical protein HG535_0C01110 [Zygotorulaspora mrakii]
MGYHANLADFSDVDDRKEEALKMLLENYKALTIDQNNWVCNLSNASSLIWHCYRSLSIDINWAGFYFVNDDKKELLLGPFQGKVACQTIPFGKGICGVAAATQETQLVEDVDKAPHHIACDGDTKSEIVVPIVNNGTKRTLAVIDIDCRDFNAFEDLDKEYLEQLGKLIGETCIF